MRIAVISDIHGNIRALEAVLAHIRSMGDIERIVNAGDILSGPLEPAATADLLMSLDLPTIAGNHERQLLACAQRPGGPSDQFAFESTSDRHRDWLAQLPKTLALSPEVFICHATPCNDLDYLLEDVSSGRACLDAEAAIGNRLGDVRYPLVLCGHTHLPRCYRMADGRLIVNAGSVGLQAYTADKPLDHVMENGSPHARFVVCERTDRGWSVQHHAVAYDWDAAAATARWNGRPDWAEWLSSGRAAPGGVAR